MTMRKRKKGLCKRLLNFLALGFVLLPPLSYAASDAGGKPERTDIVVAYPQPSGVFTPLYVSYESGLFKKHGLEVKLQVLNPQSTLQAVISGSADWAPPAIW